MAVKKSLLNGYTYQDLFDTQEALDTGILGGVKYGTETTSTRMESPIGSINISNRLFGGPTTTDLYANKENLGAVTNQSDAIAANKKRKEEQKLKAQQGFGTSQSILGGGAF